VNDRLTSFGSTRFAGRRMRVRPGCGASPATLPSQVDGWLRTIEDTDE
jgi:hypothetical protein